MQPDPDSSWTDQEKWTWECIVSGQPADFYDYPERFGAVSGPAARDEWDNPDALNRILRPEFLQMVLLQHPWCDALPRQGVRIGGARFVSAIDLSYASFNAQLSLRACRFEDDINLRCISTPQWLNFGQSILSATLNLDMASIGNAVILDETAAFGKVSLDGAQIAQQLSANGATMNALFSMNGIEIERGLFLRNEGTFSEIDLRGAEVGGALELESSSFWGEIEMNGAVIDGYMNLQDASFFGRVTLLGVQISGSINGQGAEFWEPLSLNQARIEGSCRFEHAKPRGELDFRYAELGGMLVLSGVDFQGDIGLEGSVIKRGLVLHHAHIVGLIRMRGAIIGERLGLDHLALFGSLDMESLTLNGDLLFRCGEILPMSMSGAEYPGSVFTESYYHDSHRAIHGPVYAATDDGRVWLIHAQVDGNIDLSDSKFGVVDMRTLRVGGEMRFGIGAAHARWSGGSYLDLRGAHANVLWWHASAWPSSIRLTGFTYELLAGYKSDSTAGDPVNELDKYVRWLSLDRTQSLQPYAQLATVLQKLGEREIANDIRYEAKKRQYRNSDGMPAVLLFLQWITVGFGYRLRYALGWACVLVIVGALWLALGKEVIDPSIESPIFFSLDAVLPLIELSPAHDEIVLTGLTKWCFGVLRIFGWVLISFVIAGLSGIIKQV